MTIKKKLLIGAVSLLVVGGVLAISGYFMGAKFSINDENFGFGNGIGISSGEKIKKEYKLEKFTDLEIDIDMAKVKIKQGDGYGVEVSYNPKYSVISHEIKGNKLVVTEEGSVKSGIDFGMNSANSYVTVTIPKGEELGAANINVSMGNLEVSNIKCKSIDAKLDMGKFIGDNIITDSIKCEASMGSVNINNINSKSSYFGVSMGSVDISGAFYGKTEVNANQGSVEINTTLGVDQYSFDLNADMGSIEVNGKDIKGNFIKEVNSSNLIKVSTDMGSIDIENIK
ncbi:MAG: DUF4097 family beta strand repeat-containing protein [Clostridium sp.]